MWDLLVLTAGSKTQKRDFETLLAEIDVSRFCNRTIVIADFPPAVKIGSGGATLNILDKLGSTVDGQRVLLIHSGGLSQRMPHLSAIGKIFAVLPDGCTILEKKLSTYERLPSILPPGLLVSASDVIEDVSKFTRCDSAEMIAFATESNLEIAKDHGVFVLDSEGRLKCVLQKPSLREIEDAAAVLPSGNALTDCFYWISWSICDQLLKLWRQKGPCTVETCCYGDFMRPLGYEPLLDYINQGSEELSRWRSYLAEIFSRITPSIVNLGIESFFHMGTPLELQDHCRRDSIFARKFLKAFSEAVHCSLVDCTIGSGSKLEYCRMKNATIGEGCIISGCESNDPLQIADKSMLFTICIKEQGKRHYSTILLRTDDDVKAKKEQLCWMGQRTCETDVSLWNAKLFPIEKSRQASLHATLKTMQGMEFGGRRISIAEAVTESDIDEMITFRRSLRHQLLSSSSP